MNEQVIILVLSTQLNDYDSFKQALRNTWLSDISSKNCRYFFYEGGHNCNEIDGDTIKLTEDDSLNGTYNKFVSALNVLDKSGISYECIYRTNLSSYIDVDKLLEFVSSVENKADVIAAVVGKTYHLREKMYLRKFLRKLSIFGVFGKTIFFPSGSGFFIGKNFINELLSIGQVRGALIDDVMVGRLLNLKEKDITTLGRWDVIDFGHAYYRSSSTTKEPKVNLFHYRLKTKDRKFDYSLMYFLHDKNVRKKLVELGENYVP